MGLKNQYFKSLVRHAKLKTKNYNLNTNNKTLTNRKQKHGH